MILIYIIALLSISMFSSFTTSYHLQTANRAIIYAPIELIESSLEIINKANDKNLYFDKALLIENLDNYYHKQLKGHLDNITTQYYFYNQNDQSICVSDNCAAVEITVRGSYSFFFNYQRTVSYEIKKGAVYGQ